MKDLQSDEIKSSVKQRYGDIAQHQKVGFGCGPSTCCSGPAPSGLPGSPLNPGYSAQQMQAAPEGSNLGLGCGNPHVLAALQPGETVLDLGSGPGSDSFLAARQVGQSGRVIGVDMTPEMVAKAQEHARAGGYSNVEIRLGEIEKLPLEDTSVNVIISNCVINLSPDKLSVFREAFRVLKPGGRLAITDVIATAPLPEDVRNDLALYSSCISGAVTVPELESMLREAGFRSIRIQPLEGSRELVREWAPGRNIEDCIASATIEAVKPRD